MQAVIFVGIQGSGKTTFYTERFLKTHVRVSMDLLKTRGKENRFLHLCMETSQKVVIDNTNPTAASRAGYIELAKGYRFQVVGYYFNANIHEALTRNKQRTGKEVIAEIGIRATYKKLLPPTLHEGFDKLYEVQLVNHHFQVDEIR